ncbi:STAS domain-containing protein [Streptomyces racemochromogenes]|uniref:STAS domain-containing protein n=1 Tax=Streptomyces racemochromogenes TaxID=67353 RepID=UPI000F6BAC1F|nr:anti-sigma factor antagonist [Streptomyces sp. W1SF4]
MEPSPSVNPAHEAETLAPDAVMPGLSTHRLAGPAGTRILAVVGEADIDTEPALARALNAALREPPVPQALTVDCSGLWFCGCAGLHQLLRVRRAAAEAGVSFALAALSPQATRLLDLTGTRAVFDVLPAVPPMPPTKPRTPGRAVPAGRNPRRAGGPAPAPDAVPADVGIGAQVAALTAQIERQTNAGQWELSEDDTALARATATRLGTFVGAAAVQEALPGIERLEYLREALAVLAVGTAHTHGQLAWFLGRAAAALSPVLHWRALTADQEHALGTIVPTLEEFTDAENAVRRLDTVLARTTTHGPATEAAPACPRAGSRDL